MLKRFRGKTVLYVWRLIFSSIVIISAIANICTMSIVRYNLGSETKQKNYYVLRYIQKNCDNVFAEAKRICEMFAAHPTARQLGTMESTAEARLLAAALSDEMVNLNVGIYLEDFYIYFPKSSLVASNGGIWSAQDFYMRHSGMEESYDAWIEKMNRQKNFSIEDREAEIDFYMGGEGYSICVAADKAKTQKEMFLAENQDIILTVNSRKEIMYKWGNPGDDLDIQKLINAGEDGYELMVNDTLMLSMCKKSDNTGYRYIYLSPVSVQYKMMRETVTIGMITNVISILVMIALFLLLEKWNYGQIRTLMKDVNAERENHPHENEFDVIKKDILLYKKKLNRYEKKAMKDDALRRQIFVSDVLRGLESAEKEQNVFKARQYYGVFIIEVEDYGIFADDPAPETEYKDDVQMVIKNIFDDVVGQDKMEWAVLGGMQVGVFSSAIALYENYRLMFSEVFAEIKKIMLEHFEVNLNFYISQQLEGVEKLPKAYEQAKKSYEFGQIYGDTEVFYEDIAENVAKYPTVAHDIENQLISAVKEHNKGQAWELIEKMLEESLHVRHVGQEYIRNFAAIIIHIVQKAAERDIFVSSESKLELRDFSDIEKLKEYFMYVLEKAMEKENRAAEKDLSDMIAEHIRSNYSDPDLCVTSIGEEFHMSPQYISRIFKEKMGFRIVDYIHRLRIEYAKELLIQDPRMKVEDIAEEVGYGTARIFMMRFKEREGVTPTQYRKIAK